MEEEENISSMQIRFTNIVNKLQNPGKTISNQDFTNKILMCMTRKWQPKVTSIKKSQNLCTLDITVLFRIRKLKDSEEIFKKKEKKSIALKAFLSKAT